MRGVRIYFFATNRILQIQRMSENNESAAQNTAIAFQLRVLCQQLELLSRLNMDLTDNLKWIKKQNIGNYRRGNMVRKGIPTSRTRNPNRETLNCENSKPENQKSRTLNHETPTSQGLFGLNEDFEHFSKKQHIMPPYTLNLNRKPRTPNAKPRTAKTLNPQLEP